VLRQSFAPFVKVLRTLVYVRAGRHIDDREELIDAGAEIFNLRAETLRQLVAWREGRIVLSGDDWEQAMRGLFETLQSLSGAIDG
jgi:hypothetical protein